MNIVHNYEGFSMWMEYIIMRYSEYELNLELWEICWMNTIYNSERFSEWIQSRIMKSIIMRYSVD